MPFPVKAFATVIMLALPTVTSAQTISGPPQAGTQQHLGNCNLIQYLSLVGRNVGNVALPPNSRVIRLRNETSVPAVTNFDLSRLSVVTGRYGNITRVYCG